MRDKQNPIDSAVGRNLSVFLGRANRGGIGPSLLLQTDWLESFKSSLRLRLEGDKDSDCWILLCILEDMLDMFEDTTGGSVHAFGLDWSPSDMSLADVRRKQEPDLLKRLKTLKSMKCSLGEWVNDVDEEIFMILETGPNDYVLCLNCQASHHEEMDSCPECGSDAEGVVFSADEIAATDGGLSQIMGELEEDSDKYPYDFGRSDVRRGDCDGGSKCND